MENSETEQFSQGMLDFIDNFYEQPIFDWELDEEIEEFSSNPIDLNFRILAFDASASPIIHGHTEEKYHTILLKLHRFLKLEKGQQLTAQYLNNSNFEKFINAEANVCHILVPTKLQVLL